MRKFFVIGVFSLVPLVFCAGCGDDSEGPVDPTVATEEWVTEADAGVGTGDWTLKLKKSGGVKVDGNWDYDWNGLPVECPFTDGNVTILGADLSLTATGTATVTLAGPPPVTSTSPFVLNVSGECSDGDGSGTYDITFSNSQWPVHQINGVWTATRDSGEGITHETSAK